MPRHSPPMKWSGLQPFIRLVMQKSWSVQVHCSSRDFVSSQQEGQLSDWPPEDGGFCLDILDQFFLVRVGLGEDPLLQLHVHCPEQSIRAGVGLDHLGHGPLALELSTISQHYQVTHCIISSLLMPLGGLL